MTTRASRARRAGARRCSRTADRTRFRIWAPDAADGCALEIEGRPPRGRCGGWRTAGSRRRPRSAPARATASGSRRTSPCPIRRRGSQAGDVHDPSVVVDPRAFAWRQRGVARAALARDGALRGPRRRAWAASAACEAALPRLARPRRHRGRADAGRGLPGQAQLGLRRRAALRARCGLRHARRAEVAGRRGARPRADGVPRRGLQPLRAGRHLPARLRASASSTRASHTPWGAAIDFTRRRRCATSSRRTRSTGWTSTASTGCASTPSTPSPSATGCDTLAARVRREITDRHVHLVLENERNGASHLRPRGRLRRAVERRRPQHPAPVADAASARATTRTSHEDGAAKLGHACWSRASCSRASARRTSARRAASLPRTCRRPPSCCSCRTTTRSATAPSASASTQLADPGRAARRHRAAAAVAAGADAVHGRGVGRHRALPVLHRPQRRARAAGDGRQAQGVRQVRRPSRTRRSASASPTRTPRRPSAPPSRTRRKRSARRTPPCSTCTGACSRSGASASSRTCPGPRSLGARAVGDGGGAGPLAAGRRLAPRHRLQPVGLARRPAAATGDLLFESADGAATSLASGTLPPHACVALIEPPRPAAGAPMEKDAG